MGASVVLALSACARPEESQADARTLVAIDDMIRAEDWCALRGFVVQNPETVQGSDDLAVELRAFLAETAGRCVVGANPDDAAPDTEALGRAVTEARQDEPARGSGAGAPAASPGGAPGARPVPSPGGAPGTDPAPSPGGTPGATPAPSPGGTAGPGAPSSGIGIDIDLGAPLPGVGIGLQGSSDGPSGDTPDPAPAGTGGGGAAGRASVPGVGLGVELQGRGGGAALGVAVGRSDDGENDDGENDD